MKDFKIFYDEREDILYLGKEGKEEEVVEVAPGLNIEMDSSGRVIGIELLRASSLLKDVIKPITRKAEAC
jgi:uncharacterized protein YuzE